MSEDVSATFVVTYYRRLYAAPLAMRKFYNSFSLLTRVTSGVKRKVVSPADERRSSGRRARIASISLRPSSIPFSKAGM